MKTVTAPNNHRVFQTAASRALGAALVTVAVFLGGCGPSPEAVCDKGIELATGEVGAAGAKAALGTKEECVKTESRRKEMQGALKYKENNACLMSAKSWADAKGCGK